MYILASDYDGTLSIDGISDEVRAWIARFRAAGNLFGIVTGRDYWMYETVEQEGLAIDFIIALNGAMLIATDGPDAGKILRYERQKNNGCIRWIAEHVGLRYGHEVSTVFCRERRTFHARCPDGRLPDGTVRWDPIGEADTIPLFTQMNTHCDTAQEARRCVGEINAAWGQTVNALQNGVCIDIPPAGIDKGEGVARFALERGIPADHVYCAGDNMNDWAMVSRFHGLVVKNAVPELKAVSEGVFDDVGAMIRYILNGKC